MPKRKPKEHIPNSLRPVPKSKREVRYGIGIEYKPNSFGVTHGPTIDMNSLLEIVGGNNKTFIIRFNEDGTDDTIWKWKEDRWIGCSND